MAMTKRSGLGRGLDSIFVENASPESTGGSILRVSEIMPRADQPRKQFDEAALTALSDSIRENGLIQPVVVRPAASGFYELIAGERRWRAAKMAGLTEIPAVIMETDERKTAELALIENIQREDLNPTEVGMAYRALMDEYGMTQEALAKTVGKSRSAVANALRLLDLPENVRAMLNEKKLTEGHAKVLLGVKDAALLEALAQTVAEKGLNVRQTELLVKRALREQLKAEEEEEDERLPEIDYRAILAQKATERLGRQTKIVGKAGKPGQLILHYEDDRDLEALLAAICGSELFADF